MNKRTQILKQITSEKLPNLIEYQPTGIKSNSKGSREIHMLEEQQTLLNEQIFTISEKIKINASHLQVWLSKFVHVPLSQSNISLKID
jgi:hypothetical protein